MTIEIIRMMSAKILRTVPIIPQIYPDLAWAFSFFRLEPKQIAIIPRIKLAKIMERIPQTREPVSVPVASLFPLSLSRTSYFRHLTLHHNWNKTYHLGCLVVHIADRIFDFHFYKLLLLFYQILFLK